MVDAGDLLHPPGGIDFDGDPRVCDGLTTGVASVDIGCDEYNFSHLELIDPVNPGGTVRLETTAPAGYMYCLAAAVIVADFTVGSSSRRPSSRWASSTRSSSRRASSPASRRICSAAG